MASASANTPETTPAHRPSHWHFAVIALLVIWGPMYRALFDKGWMLLGGLPLVGQWAQLQNLAELVSAPAFAGVGLGLTVLTAQRPQHEHQALFFSAALLGWVSTAPLLAAVLIWPTQIAQWLGLDPSLHTWLVWIALSGWAGILFGQLSSYWLGQQRHAHVLTLSVATGLPALIALLIASQFAPHNALQNAPEHGLQYVVWAGLLVGCAGLLGLLVALMQWMKQTPNARAQLHTAFKTVAVYLPAGFSIGLLTPLSAMAIRSSLAHQIDWQAAGTATALWRASDWILSSASAFLYYHYLPKLSLWAQAGQLRAQLPQVMRRMVLPCGTLLLVLWLLQTSVLPLLYDERLQASPAVTAALWGGDLLRIVAAVLLYALFALHASKTIAWGEWLSQPLLALLLAMGAAQSLMFTGLAHMGTYALYATVNALAVAWHLRQVGHHPG
jgi:hypothetical protein